MLFKVDFKKRKMLQKYRRSDGDEEISLKNTFTFQSILNFENIAVSFFSF